jgi:hypothetical protein
MFDRYFQGESKGQSVVGRRRRRLLFGTAIVLAASAFASAASAGTYLITMASGSKFESRYKPKMAAWDASKILVLSDVGNWVALRRSDVVKIESTTENRGLGFVINNTTIALGWAPNDNLTPEQETEAAQAAARAGLANPQTTNYSVNQFVEPGATQGLPSGLIGGGGNYSTQGQPVYTLPTPAPAVNLTPPVNPNQPSGQ